MSTVVLKITVCAALTAVLAAAVQGAPEIAGPTAQLIVKIGDRYRVANVDYHDGLHYPHLERDTAEPALLDDILAARP